MNVVTVVNSASLTAGGAERIARRLHRGYQDQGLEARLVSLLDCDLSGLRGASSLKLASPYHPLAIVRLWRRLAKIARDADIIHAHLFPTGLYVSILRALGLIRARCVYTEHSTSNRRRAIPIMKLIDALMYRGFDQIFAISDAVAEALVAARPGLAGKVQVATNGVELRYDAAPTRIDREVPVIVTVGRLVPLKGHDTALEALSRLKDRRFRYVIVGDGPERGALQARAESLGLGDRVEFVGQTPDPWSFLEVADIFLLLSRWEGFGLAAAEAMNAGLPCVVSDVPGLADLVGRDEAAGRLAPAGDVAAVADALAGLLDDPALRRRLGEIGHRRSLEYGEGRMVAAYLTAFDALMEKGGHAH